MLKIQKHETAYATKIYKNYKHSPKRFEKDMFSIVLQKCPKTSLIVWPRAKSVQKSQVYCLPKIFFWLATYCKLDFFRVDLLHALYQKALINAKKLMFSEVATFKIYAYLNCPFGYVFCCF